jgi:hypothetical protein
MNAARTREEAFVVASACDCLRSTSLKHVHAAGARLRHPAAAGGEVTWAAAAVVVLLGHHIRGPWSFRSCEKRSSQALLVVVCYYGRSARWCRWWGWTLSSTGSWRQQRVGSQVERGEQAAKDDN